MVGGMWDTNEIHTARGVGPVKYRTPLKRTSPVICKMNSHFMYLYDNIVMYSSGNPLKYMTPIMSE